MATSTIWLYGSKKPYKLHNFKLQQERNMQIDDLETYLTDFQLARFDNVQYFKRELKKDIKLNMPQEALAEDYDVKYQYMKVQNSDSTKPLYYYIQNYSWVSKSTIRFTIYLDTINTFSSLFEFSQKTKIYREHKDRFYKSYPSNTKHLNVPKSAWTDKNMGGSVVYKTAKMTLYEPDYKQYKAGEWNISVSNLSPAWLTVTTAEAEDYGYYTIELTNKTKNPLPDDTDFDVNFTTNLTKLIRKIDFQSEGIQAPEYKKDETIIYNDVDKYKWYLIYDKIDKNSSTINTYLVAESKIECFIASSLQEENFIDLNTIEKPVDDKSYYAFTSDSILYEGENERQTLYPGSLENKGRYLDSFGNSMFCLFFNHHTNKWEMKLNENPSNITYNSKNFKDYYVFDGTDNKIFYDYDVNLSYISSSGNTSLFLGPRYRYSFNQLEKKTINSFWDIDRTKSTLMKIINCPYCPIPYTIDENKNYNFSSTIAKYEEIELGSYNSSTQKYNKINVIKISPSISKFSNIIYNCTNLINENLYCDIDLTTEDRNDINESKLFHSDFRNLKLVYDSFVYPINFEKINALNISDVNLKLYTSKDVVSRFLFSFEGLNQKGKTEETYDGFLSVNRNNEMPIFTDDYLNYLRNGYNYDVKNKNIKIAGQWIGAAVSTAAAIAGTVGSFGSAGAFLIPAAIGQLSSAITSTVNAENNLEKKLQETKNQASSVSGSDDIDILEAYSNNKAKFCYYQVSDRLKKQMADLFYYFGYTSNEMKVPDEYSRIWFNYIQCSPVFTNTYNWSDDIIKDITYRFEQGLTVYHHRNNTWDFDQTKENYESWLFA